MTYFCDNLPAQNNDTVCQLSVKIKSCPIGWNSQMDYQGNPTGYCTRPIQNYEVYNPPKL
jgi:hypothetical protein